MYRGRSVTGIVDARLGSSPLDRRAMMPLGTTPVIGRLVARLEAVDWIDRLVVVTGSVGGDDPVADYCRSSIGSVELHQTAAGDVLKGAYEIIDEDLPDWVVHVTDATPLVSTKYLTTMAEHMDDHRLDGVCADPMRTGLTAGMGAGLYHRQAIVDAHLLAVDPDDRCRLDSFIRRRPCAFRLGYPPAPPALRSNCRLRLETIDDYRLIKTIVRSLRRPGRIIDEARAVQWLERRPDIARVNLPRASRPS